ncbi:MAG: inorganic diphosphatase, partial [Alphaproteobacteria bacterium]|nr:inorganic diphosphatase [Alphaproteobacteria bacterium]
DPYYEKISRIDELPLSLRSKIQYFFQHYKDLEPKSWSKTLGWDDRVRAEKIIMESIKRAAGDKVKKNKK